MTFYDKDDAMHNNSIKTPELLFVISNPVIETETPSYYNVSFRKNILFEKFIIWHHVLVDMSI